MPKNTKIAILLDKKNSWLKSFINKNAFKNIKKKTKVLISFEPKKIRKFNIVFILGFTKILNKNFLNANNLCLVIHASKLPSNKGFAPMQWQILGKKNIIPFSLIKINEKVDSGDIVLTDTVRFNGTELYEEIRRKQAQKTIYMIKKFMKIYPKFKTIKQKGRSNFLRKRSKKDSELNINKSIKEQFNLMRIANNEEWPLFFKYKNKTYFLKITKEMK
jgi:methionyl-tRNA formyltransferase